MSCIVTIWKAQSLGLNVTMDPEVDGGITGWSIRCIVRRSPIHDPVITKTVGSGITITGAQTFSVVFDVEDTEDLDGTFNFDIWRTDGSSNTYPIFVNGSLIVNNSSNYP